jgi:hypothetical protein
VLVLVLVLVGGAAPEPDESEPDESEPDEHAAVAAISATPSVRRSL